MPDHNMAGLWPASIDVERLAFTPEGRTLLPGSWNHSLRVWDLQNEVGEDTDMTSITRAPARRSARPCD